MFIFLQKSIDDIKKVLYLGLVNVERWQRGNAADC